MADGENRRGDEIHHKAQECQEIRVYACRGERTDNFVEQPLASVPMPPVSVAMRI